MNVGARMIQEHGDQWVVYLRNIYRGSRDGYGLNDFFDLVKDHTHIIFFCRVAGTDHVFGGYNKIGHKNFPKTPGSPMYKDFEDMSAFLFSLNHRTKHVPVMRKDKCVRHTHLDFLIVMGQAPDIAISANCDEAKQNAKDLKSMSAFGINGGTYKVYDELNTENAPSYFAGANRF